MIEIAMETFLPALLKWSVMRSSVLKDKVDLLMRSAWRPPRTARAPPPTIPMIAIICLVRGRKKGSHGMPAHRSERPHTITPALTGIQQQNVRVATIVMLLMLKCYLKTVVDLSKILRPAQQVCFSVVGDAE